MNDMPVSSEFIEKLHKSFLNILISLMTASTISLDYSREATRDFLALFPANSIEELNTKLKLFVESHAEFKSIHIEFMKLRETNQTDDVLNKMRTLMKENNLDKAVQITQ